MPPYDDWNKFDEDEDEELQDTSVRVYLIGPTVTGDQPDSQSVFCSTLRESTMSFFLPLTAHGQC
jgi:hypothetical protein